MSLEREEITKETIGAAFEVHNELGYGFLEKVYQNAMLVALKLRGVSAEAEQLINVHFRDHVVGEYKADITVEDVIVELKVASKYNPQDEPQLLNELKATKSPVGLLINFGREKVEFKRFISSTKASA
ncbi:MAG: GxxExxY protein [Lentimonas sp.]